MLKPILPTNLCIRVTGQLFSYEKKKYRVAGGENNVDLKMETVVRESGYPSTYASLTRRKTIGL